MRIGNRNWTRRCKRLVVLIAVPVISRRTAVFLCASLAFACVGPETKPLANDGPLRVSVLPERPEDQLRYEYGPLYEYLTDTTGRTIDPVFFATYEEALDSFIDGNIDIMYFGGYSFVIAQAKADAQALVMRSIDTRFTTYFIARSDTPGDTIEEFRGEAFAFSTELSTSGHLMPRQFLMESSIVPETFFGEVRYSGKHDTTAYWIRDGVVALGAANGPIFEAMIANGKLQRDDFKIVGETPKYPNYVWAVRADLNESTKSALMDAFLDLIPQTSPGREILPRLRAHHFVAARPSDFEPLAKIVEELGPTGPRPEA